MRRIIAVLLFSLFIAACSACGGPHGSRRVSYDDPASARIATVDISAVLLVEKEDGTQTLTSSGGTGWAIATRDGVTMVVTAGHVCLKEGDLIPNRTDITVRASVYSVTTRAGDDFLATVVYDNDIVDDRADDTCVMEVVGWTPDVVMELSRKPTSEIEFGERIWYVGYPAGTLAIFEGRLTAYVDEGGYVIGSMDAFFGASGSAILDRSGRVIGMLSAIGQFRSIVYLVPVEYLWEAERFAREHLRGLTEK